MNSTGKQRAKPRENISWTKQFLFQSIKTSIFTFLILLVTKWPWTGLWPSEGWKRVESRNGWCMGVRLDTSWRHLTCLALYEIRFSPVLLMLSLLKSSAREITRLNLGFQCCVPDPALSKHSEIYFFKGHYLNVSTVSFRWLCFFNESAIDFGGIFGYLLETSLYCWLTIVHL